MEIEADVDQIFTVKVQDALQVGIGQDLLPSGLLHQIDNGLVLVQAELLSEMQSQRLIAILPIYINNPTGGGGGEEGNTPIKNLHPGKSENVTDTVRTAIEPRCGPVFHARLTPEHRYRSTDLHERQTVSHDI